MCVTRDQFKALVEGSILGASAPAPIEEAASTPAIEIEAPATTPAPKGADGTDENASTTPSDAVEVEPVEPTEEDPAPKEELELEEPVDEPTGEPEPATEAPPSAAEPTAAAQ